MINLLKETRKAIANSGHTEKDVVFIGSLDSGHACTMQEFCVLADVDYDNGYGSPEVPRDLVVVFCDGGTLRRMEYDGSEWWRYFPPVRVPSKTRPIMRIVHRDAGDRTVGEVQEPGEE